MNAIIERSQRFLDRSLGIGSRVLLLVCAALIFPTRLWPAAEPAGAWVPFALGILALLFSGLACRVKSGTCSTSR